MFRGIHPPGSVKRSRQNHISVSYGLTSSMMKLSMIVKCFRISRAISSPVFAVQLLFENRLAYGLTSSMMKLSMIDRCDIISVLQ